MNPDLILALVIAFVFGTCAGSFLNVVVYRLPRGISIVHPGSRCGACGTLLAWHDNLPVLGWLLLRGNCRHCGTHFSPRYLFMELGVGALTALTVWAAFRSSSLWSPALAFSGAPWLAPMAAALALTVLVWLLLAASLIDIEHLIIPDEISKGFQILAIPLACLTSAGLAWGWDPSGWLGRRDVLGMLTPTPGKAALIFGASLAVGLGLILACLPLARRIYGRWAATGQSWTEEDHRAFRAGAYWFSAMTLFWSLPVFALLWWRPAGGDGFPWWVFASVVPIQAILGAMAGWWLPYLVGLGGTVAFRRSAMGFGDVKLFAAVGAFLGPIGVIIAFALATLLGTVIGLPLRLLGGGRELPFGPSLAMGAALALPLAPWLGPRLIAPLLG